MIHVHVEVAKNTNSVVEKETTNLKKNTTEKIAEETGLEYLEIVDYTLPVYDGKYLEKDVTIRGEVYRALLPKLSSADKNEKRQALLALKIALAAIDSNNVFDVVN